LRCGEIVPSFRYRALTQAGEVVSGSISARPPPRWCAKSNISGWFRIDAVSERDGRGGPPASSLDFLTKPSAEDITIFTRDLALLLKSGARIDAALDLLATDMGHRPAAADRAKIRSSILSGESFAESLSHHPTVFPAMFVALVRVGEASGTLDHILDLLARRSAAQRSGAPQVHRSKRATPAFPGCSGRAAC